MTWQPYALVALAVLVIGTLAFAAQFTGWDEKMVLGCVLGGGMGLMLMLLSLAGMKRALKEESKSAALGHVFGGFLLRLVILTVGVFALVKTGYANPIGFALTFVAAVLLFLGVQVYWVDASLRLKKSPGEASPQ
ncbi:MAG: ATP synthase subunit I [Planctomycetes bacterium]|jgi:Ca2+/Na+ antiporter|nr:ATP synthase subunit I [Planctomycetota bacterium]